MQYRLTCLVDRCLKGSAMAGARTFKPTRRLPERPAECDIQLPSMPIDWSVHEVDQVSGGRLGKAELVYRRRIAAEAGTDGAFGVDNRYLLAQADIHQPLLDEQGRSAPERWELHRARTMVVVPIPDVDDPQSVREAAVEIAKAALGPFAGELMLCLYAIANDPPNWRNPAFTVSLNDLLDRMGYARDAQGRHYSVTAGRSRPPFWRCTSRTWASGTRMPAASSRPWLHRYWRVLAIKPVKRRST